MKLKQLTPNYILYYYIVSNQIEKVYGLPETPEGHRTRKPGGPGSAGTRTCARGDAEGESVSCRRHILSPSPIDPHAARYFPPSLSARVPRPIPPRRHQVNYWSIRSAFDLILRFEPSCTDPGLLPLQISAAEFRTVFVFATFELIILEESRSRVEWALLDFCATMVVC